MPLLLTDAAHWGLALVPVLILLGIFVWLDAFKLMSRKEVSGLLALGAIGALAAWPVSGRLLDSSPPGIGKTELALHYVAGGGMPRNIVTRS